MYIIASNSLVIDSYLFQGSQKPVITRDESSGSQIGDGKEEDGLQGIKHMRCAKKVFFANSNDSSEKKQPHDEVK